MMQIDHSHYHVPNNSTIPTMLVSLRILSAQLGAATRPAPVYRFHVWTEERQGLATPNTCF